MKMLGKLARLLAARYVCQNCEKEKERRAVAHNATKCLERNSLLAESNQAASIEIHRLEKALANAVKLFATPCAADAQGTHGGNNCRSLRTDVAGQLNPTWVEWLMGFPQGWTDLNASETL